MPKTHTTHKPLSHHAYVSDGVVEETVLHPVESCAQCGLPKRHPRHDLPPVPAAAAAIDSRRLGEPSTLEET